MITPAWHLRQARAGDYDFLRALNEATMRDYVDAVWGWDDEAQDEFFKRRFDPARWQVIASDESDIGVLIVDEADDEIYVAEIQVAPECQGRGIGSAVLRALMDDGTNRGKAVTLRVLHANGRARGLYERLGFEPFKETETHTYLRFDGRPSV
jgi:ribosomal protein S18 acetylase RimI-like enzyme